MSDVIKKIKTSPLALKIRGSKPMMAMRAFFRSFNEKEQRQKRQAFYSQFLKKGDLYFDVGANYGNRIEPLIELGINIVAVEPQSKCVQYLAEKFGDKIKLIPKGLGSKEEEKTFFESSNSVLSSFSSEWIEATKESGRFSHYKWEEKGKIKITTLDKLISEYGTPRFIKIDVEGFELDVLKGLSTPVELISYEYSPEQKDRAIACLHRIRDNSAGNVACNYSEGESMDWSLKEWITPKAMEDLILSPGFMKAGFGDIYVKHVSRK